MNLPGMQTGCSTNTPTIFRGKTRGLIEMSQRLWPTPTRRDRFTPCPQLLNTLGSVGTPAPGPTTKSPPIPPLVTEFGAQALAHIDSLRSFIPVHSLRPETDADWAPWSFHNFQRKETFEIAGVARGEHLRDWVANTQEYQSELIQLAAESYRRQRFAPVGGIFQFMFVECWPSIGWAMVGHDRRPKPSYYALQTAFQPLLPSIEWTRRAWPAEDPAELALWVINDFGHGFVGAWLSYAILEDDTVLFENRLKIDVGADSATRIATVASTPSTPGTYELWVRLEAEGLWAPATNHLTFEVLPPGLPIGTEDHAP